MERPANLAERQAAILAHGLPCRLRCSHAGGFTAIYAEPLPGWVDLCHPAEAARLAAEGWEYHISLAYELPCAAAWGRLCARWHGREVVLEVDYFTANCVAVLSWSGVAADPDAWALYLSGGMGHKWWENRFGLHISM